MTDNADVKRLRSRCAAHYERVLELEKRLAVLGAEHRELKEAVNELIKEHTAGSNAYREVQRLKEMSVKWLT